MLGRNGELHNDDGNGGKCSFMRFIRGIAFLKAWLIAIYSASVVLKAISDCSLLCQKRGHPKSKITNQDWDRTLLGSRDVSFAPAKSAST